MKKGFTLIELLAVIVILTIILVIAVPRILKTIDNVKIEAFNNQVKVFEKATDIYINKKIMSGEQIEEYVTMEKLVESGVLKETISDPRTKNQLLGVIKISRKNNEYIKEYLEISKDSGEVVFIDQNKTIKNITIEGNSEQAITIPGKNLFSIENMIENGASNGMSLSILGKEIYNNSNALWHSTIAYTENYWSYYIGKFEQNKQYTLSFKGKIVNETDSRTVVSIGFKYTDGTTKMVTIRNIEEYKILTSDIGKNISYISFFNWGYGGKAVLWDIQLEEGSTATAYEQYIPNSPTATYPSKINSSGNSNLVVGGCNIFDINTMPMTETSKQGEVLSFNPLTYDRILYKQHWVPKPSTPYTIVLDITENTFSQPISLYSDNRFYFATNLGSISIGATGRRVYSGTTRSDFSTVTIGSLWFQTHNSVTGTFKFKLMILEGTYSIDAIPPSTSCKTPTTTKIPIPVLNKIGNIKDTYNPITGEYIKKIGVKIFDGSENWILNTSADKIFDNVNVFHIIDALWQNQLGISTHFILNNNNDNTEHIRIASGYIFTYLSKLKATNAATFKTFLANQYAAGTPLTIHYQLATPITTNLGAMIVPKDANYIYLDSEVKGNIIIEYN